MPFFYPLWSCKSKLPWSNFSVNCGFRIPYRGMVCGMYSKILMGCPCVGGRRVVNFSLDIFSFRKSFTSPQWISMNPLRTNEFTIPFKNNSLIAPKKSIRCRSVQKVHPNHTASTRIPCSGNIVCLHLSHQPAPFIFQPYRISIPR